MITLRTAELSELSAAMELIDGAKAYLKEQGIDQWQQGYPDAACIRRDLEKGKGHFVVDGPQILGYVCIDFDGEPAYQTLNGTWIGGEQPYVVAHRLALASSTRGKGLAHTVFRVIGEKACAAGVYSFRVDTDEDNAIMKHLLNRNGFTYCGSIWFDNSVKIAYEKLLRA